MNNRKPNRLAGEKSPYLLQHAGNPVDWYPWSEEAFIAAKKEDKPVFLSIGYSTCHWCHVMAHESFENDAVAALLNNTFICIKVDREERPDIDKIYMAVCQMMTGSGGWPLTIVMTPDKKPFFAATYIPDRTRFGRVGLMELVPRIRDVWISRREEVIESAENVAVSLLKIDSAEPGESLSESVLHRAFIQFQESFDPQNGGFDGAPKFPTPHNLMFLLRYWKRTGKREALDMVEITLRKMRAGGIYDHLGFGFHRYSTDSRWMVPHFEKMLYDQALGALAFIEAFQATGKEEYAQTAREIFTYVLRDMRSPEGGFYSAEDADSEGEEGKFYLWTAAEVRAILSGPEADLFCKAFDITEEGNFSGEAGGVGKGQNILYLARSPADSDSGIDLSSWLESARRKLYEARESRVHPAKDDKVLTDWNALMISVLAVGARVLRDGRYMEAAVSACKFILTKLRAEDGNLLHRYRDGEAAVPASLDDYVFLINALLELYETTFEACYLREAFTMNKFVLDHFWDNEAGGFFFTDVDAERLLVRQKDLYDGAVPSGNSVALENLLRLARITADIDLERKASDMVKAFSGIVGRQPRAFSRFLSAVDFAVGPSIEIVINGNTGAEDTRQMLAALDKTFFPNKVVIFRPADEDNPEIDSISPVSGYRCAHGSKATAFVCSNFSCRRPTDNIETMLSMLSAPE